MKHLIAWGKRLSGYWQFQCEQTKQIKPEMEVAYIADEAYRLRFCNSLEEQLAKIRQAKDNKCLLGL